MNKMSKPVLKRSKSVKRSATIKSKNLVEEKIEKIKLEDYEFLQKLSRVNNGMLKLCQKIETGNYYCMKILKKIEILDPKIVEHLYNEYKILLIIYHPFILQLKGINTKDPKALYFLFEFVQGGDLSSLLERNLKFSEEHAKFYAASLVTVIDYLHKKNIIYRNINPENIFLSSNGYIKLINFSNAKILKKDYTNTLCGTPEYSSPEMLNRKGHNKSHDLWSLGIIIYHMIIGHTPFEDSDPLKMQQKILKGKPNFPKTLSKDAKNLIKHLLIIEPKKRLGNGANGIYEIISSPFFKGFDWKNLLFQNLAPPYVPLIKGNNDVSNFRKYEDNYFENPDIVIDKEKDPFYKWD
jgi:serine/threonine protein kinase